MRQINGEGLRARLIRSALGSAGVQAANRVLALALGVILARALGPDGYGIYAYAYAVMSLLMVAAEAGVPTLLMREVAAAEGRGQWGLLNGALRRGVQVVAVVSIAIASASLIALMLLAGRMAPASFYTMAVMLLVLPASALAKTLAHALRGLHRVVTAQALEMLLRPFLVIALVGTLFFLSPALRTPSIAMAAQLVAVMTVAAIAAIHLKRCVPAAAREAPAEFRSRQWLKSALPFTLIGGAGIIKSQTDIIMLGWFMNAESVGHYRVAVQGAILVAFSLQVVNAVAAPQFSRLYTSKEMARLQILVTRSAQFTFLGALPLALILLVAGEPLVTGIFGSDFAPAYIPLVILILGQLFHASFGSVGFLLSMTGHERASARLFWEAALLNVILNAALIPFYGTHGAATATTISLVVWNVRMAALVKKSLNIFPTAFRMRPQ